MKKCITFFGALFCIAGLIGCSNSMSEVSDFDDTSASEAESGFSDQSVIVSEDTAENTHDPLEDPSLDGFADHEDFDYLAYGTETQVFDSICAMKEELDKNLQADTVSFYELQGLSDVFHESGVELVIEEYFIYYSNADKVVAFMPFASESDLSARKDDLLSNHGTYENLLANKLIHDVVKSEIPTDSGIAYECTYSTRVKTGLKIRYYECQDSATGRNYILSVDLSSDGNLENAALFVFDGMNSFMCGGNASEIASLEAAYELFSVVVE